MFANELVQAFRSRTRDRGDPPFWSDEEILAWLSEAQMEAATRARLLRTERPKIVQTNEQGWFECRDVYEITRALAVEGHRRNWLKLVSEEWLDRRYPRWRDKWRMPPRWLLQYDTRLQVVPCHGPVTVHLEGYRFPCPITKLDQEPEINRAHHLRLLDWMLYRAYRVQDADSFDPTASDRAEMEFNRRFGPPVDADMRRKTRESTPQVNTTHFV